MFVFGLPISTASEMSAQIDSALQQFARVTPPALSRRLRSAALPQDSDIYAYEIDGQLRVMWMG